MQPLQIEHKVHVTIQWRSGGSLQHLVTCIWSPFIVWLHNQEQVPRLLQKRRRTGRSPGMLERPSLAVAYHFHPHSTDQNSVTRPPNLLILPQWHLTLFLFPIPTDPLLFQKLFIFYLHHPSSSFFLPSIPLTIPEHISPTLLCYCLY